MKNQTSHLENEIPKHKKKSNPKAPKKSDHKHNYCPCIFEYNKLSNDPAHGIVKSSEKGFAIGRYCSECGKIGLIKFPFYKLSDEEKLEINPETRAIPTFLLHDIFGQKYIDLNEGK